MKIFLDDDPIRDSWVDDTWTIVRTGNEALRLCLEQANCELLSLDHDLGELPPLENFTQRIGEISNPRPQNGYDVAKVLEEWAHQGWWDCVPRKIEIHSANGVGRKNMQAAIDSIERMRRERENL